MAGKKTSENKTKETNASVDAFLASIDNERRRKDARTVCEMMARITGEAPKMWGPSIVGFGKVHYKYESGREGDMGLTGFSPRKAALTLYIVPGFSQYEALMSKLGKFTTGKSCLYIKKLDDVDLKTLETLITRSVDRTRKKYKS
jgi:hypothetical protein